VRNEAEKPTGTGRKEGKDGKADDAKGMYACVASVGRQAQLTCRYKSTVPIPRNVQIVFLKNGVRKRFIGLIF
jgi:hypothetical protein